MSKVVVGLHDGSKAKARAEMAGLRVLSVTEATKAADAVMMLLPDHVQGDVCRDEIAPNLTPGKTLMFAHGFNIHCDEIKPPAGVDVSMIAPKAPGHGFASCLWKAWVCRPPWPWRRMRRDRRCRMRSRMRMGWAA